MSLEQDHGFYELMKGAELHSVSFPCNSDGEGPFWDEHGALEKFPNGYQEHSELWIVHLGDDTYRLAVNPVFESRTHSFRQHQAARGIASLRRSSKMRGS